jgi:hypothetical protein
MGSKIWRLLLGKMLWPWAQDPWNGAGSCTIHTNLYWVSIACVLWGLSMSNLTHSSSNLEYWYLWMDTQTFEALHIAIVLHVSAIFYSHQYWMQTHLFVWAMCGILIGLFQNQSTVMFVLTCLRELARLLTTIICINSHTAYGCKLHSCVCDFEFFAFFGWFLCIGCAPWRKCGCPHLML